jgi:hypothetical protein
VSGIAPLGDVNGDGFADLALTLRNFTNNNATQDTTDPAVRIVYGGATALRVASVSPTLPEVQGNAALVALSVGDLNRDGRPDLVLWSDTTLRVYLTVGGALPATGTLVDRGIVGNITSVHALGDVNGDGRPDLSLNTRTQGVLLLGTAQGFAPPTVLTPTAPTLFYDGYAPAGDFDRDGRPDVFALGRNNTELDVCLHRGTPTGLSPTPSWRISGTRTTALPMGDVNGDGFNDLLVTAGMGAPAWLALGGGARPTRLTSFMPRDYLPLPWDANRDGRADAFVPGSHLSIHYGDATVGIAPSVGSTCGFPGFDAWQVVPVGDVDGDGTADIAASPRFLNSMARDRNERTELLRVLRVGRRTTGPLPRSVTGFDGTQVLRW